MKVTYLELAGWGGGMACIFPMRFRGSMAVEMEEGRISKTDGVREKTGLMQVTCLEPVRCPEHVGLAIGLTVEQEPKTIEKYCTLPKKHVFYVHPRHVRIMT